MREIKQPPKLVNDAWYTVTNSCGEQFAGEYVEAVNEIRCDGEWVKVSELTIHNRIPDELWNG